VVTCTNNLWKIIKLREDMFFCWFESFCGKDSNLVVNSLRDEFFRVSLFATEPFKKFVASILEVEEAVRNEIIQACNPQSKIRKMPLPLLEGGFETDQATYQP
jgi:hypothetical protein